MFYYLYPKEFIKVVLSNLIKERKSGIYFLYDKDGDLLYIGIAKNLYARINKHLYGGGYNNTIDFQEFITHFSFIEIENYSKEKAEEIETQLIKKHKPIFNKSKNDYFLNKKYRFASERRIDWSKVKEINL